MKRAGITSEGVAEKLKELHGNMAAVARVFGTSRNAVWSFVQHRPTLHKLVADVREAMKDNAESSLYSAVLRGEAWAVCFFLKAQARDRGYVERQDRHHEHEHQVDWEALRRRADTPAVRGG
jgi:hypothetical protein